MPRRKHVFPFPELEEIGMAFTWPRGGFWEELFDRTRPDDKVIGAIVGERNLMYCDVKIRPIDNGSPNERNVHWYMPNWHGRKSFQEATMPQCPLYGSALPERLLRSPRTRDRGRMLKLLLDAVYTTLMHIDGTPKGEIAIRGQEDAVLEGCVRAVKALMYRTYHRSRKDDLPENESLLSGVLTEIAYGKRGEDGKVPQRNDSTARFDLAQWRDFQRP